MTVSHRLEEHLERMDKALGELIDQYEQAKYCISVAGSEASFITNKGVTKTDRPTPLTDALLLKINEGRRYINDGPVDDLARQLERQNAELRAILEYLKISTARGGQWEQPNVEGFVDAALARKQP